MHGTWHFKLQPFAAGQLTENLSISGHISRCSGILQIEYRMVGGSACRFPLPNARSAGRCHELWRHTCFELFFGIQGDPAYWEVNLSPNGCWNLYHFTDYRVGMREESSVGQPVCRVVEDDELFSLSCSIDCKTLIDDSSALELAVCSVIQDHGGSISYWAINHRGPAPDFHTRASFSMVLPGVMKNGICS